EIKLYHEDSIAAGRRDRDLGSRLGGEIARARVLYEQRVPPHVRARAPYFDDELVRTLADGDQSLLETRGCPPSLETTSASFGGTAFAACKAEAGDSPRRLAMRR